MGWTRAHPSPTTGASAGTFSGCYGATSYYDGNLFIYFESRKGSCSVRFTWHFDYYLTNSTREHFTLGSGRLPYPCWTGGALAGPVSGTFKFSYYRKEGREVINSYTLLDYATLGFTMTIAPV